MPHNPRPCCTPHSQGSAISTTTRGSAACDDREAPGRCDATKEMDCPFLRKDGGLLFRGFVGGCTRQQGPSDGIYLFNHHTSPFPAATQHKGRAGGPSGRSKSIIRRPSFSVPYQCTLFTIKVMNLFPHSPPPFPHTHSTLAKPSIVPRDFSARLPVFSFRILAASPRRERDPNKNAIN